MREMRNITRNSPYATEVEDLTCAEIQDRFQHMGLDVIRGKHTGDMYGLFVSSFVDGRMEYRRETREGFFEEAFEPHVDVIACGQQDDLILRYELKTFSIYPNTRRWSPPYRRATIQDIDKVMRDENRALILVSDEGAYLRMSGHPFDVSDEYLETGSGGVPLIEPHLGGLLPELDIVKNMNGQIHHRDAIYNETEFHVISSYVYSFGVKPTEMIRGTVSQVSRKCVECNELFNSARDAEIHYRGCANPREQRNSEGRVISIIATGRCEDH